MNTRFRSGFVLGGSHKDIPSAYLVIFKIMMRETTALPDLDWDIPLPEEMQKDRKAAIRLLVEQEEVVFDKGTRPANALGRPELVGYWDGSFLVWIDRA